MNVSLNGPWSGVKLTASLIASVGLTAGVANSQPYQISLVETVSSPAPKPYHVERYACLWAGNWFVKTPPPKPEIAGQSGPPPTCDYELTGIASLKNRQYVYLKEKSGKFHELTSGQPSDGLEVVNIVMGEQASDHRVEILTPRGKLELKFDFSAKPVPVPVPPEPKKVAPRSTPQTSRKAKREGEGWIDNSWLNEDDTGRQ